MGREDYRGVTPETEAALKNCIKAVAEEMHLEAPQYLYAILAGKESDPFARFLRLFRAVCRINPDGARGYIARLSATLRAQEPKRGEPVNVGDAAQAFGDFVAVAVEREEGLCPPEKLEKAKQRVFETVEKVTVYAPASHLRNVG